nr:unnamed protein product [Homo sapiens]
MAAAGPMTGAAASRAATAAHCSGGSKVEAVRGAVQGAAGVKPPVAAAPSLLWLCPPGPPVLLDPLPSWTLCPPGPPSLLGPPGPPALLDPLSSWTPCPPGPPVCGPCSSPPSPTHDWTPRSAAGVWALGVLWASRCLGTITGSRAHTQPLLPEHTRGSRHPDESTVPAMVFRDGEGSLSSAGTLQPG